MRCWKIAELFTEAGWQKNAYVSLDEAGKITSIGTKRPSGGAAIEAIDGWVIPGLTNSHSHGFQYAMAGLAEYSQVGYHNDDFWSWRQAMYDLALRVSPEQFEAIAAMVYAEMLRCGYTSVVEFHYLHNDVNGRAYANPIEMCERLAAAAQIAGIHLCIVPVYYRQSDFGQPAQKNQRRFLFNHIEEYEGFFESLKKFILRHTDADFGLGVHSLRAAAPEEIKAILNDHGQPIPKHLHVAEQLKEVEGCLAHLGLRPVEWLLEHTNLNANYNLVHATHLTAAEVKGLAKTGATVVLCPSTEGNLGDGFFPAADFIRAGGRWAIGSDSQIQLDPFEDLRWLDYQQRLTFKVRNVLAPKGCEGGDFLYREAWQRGRLSAGRQSAEFFVKGDIFEGLVLDMDHPLFIGKAPEKRLSAMIYGGDSSCIKGSIRKDAWRVKNHRHLHEESIKANYRRALKSLAYSSTHT